MSTGIIVRNIVKPRDAKSGSAAIAILVTGFHLLTRKKHYTKVEVFAASLADINKALSNKVKTDPYII
jgi:hypothetical protein